MGQSKKQNKLRAAVQVVIALIATSCITVKAEESSILEGAMVYPNMDFINLSQGIYGLIDGNFKTFSGFGPNITQMQEQMQQQQPDVIYCMDDNFDKDTCPGMYMNDTCFTECEGGMRFRSLGAGQQSQETPTGDQEISVMLTQPQKIISAFVQGNAESPLEIYGGLTIGNSNILIGNDTTPFSPNQQSCSVNFYDGGFKNIFNDCIGNVVSLRRLDYIYVSRDGGPKEPQQYYVINELRLYQSPNLIQINQSKLSLTGPDANNSSHPITNLVQNFQVRSSSAKYFPVIDPHGTNATFNSCYITTDKQIAAGSKSAVMTLDLSDSYFQHSVLLVGDVYAGYDPSNHTDKSQWLPPYDIYIGNSSQAVDNTKCAGGPFLQQSDPNNYQMYTDLYDGTSHQMWDYGAESWCNLEGRYTHFVFDLSDYSNSDFEISICALGVFGTRYERMKPIPSVINITQSDPVTLLVDPIVSQHVIGNTLNIQMRHKSGSDVDWVHINQKGPQHELIFDAFGVSAGNYTVILESYDINGKVQSALKTDYITVTVTTSCPINGNQEDFDKVKDIFQTTTLELNVTAGVSESYTLSLLEEFQDVFTLVQLVELVQYGCGDLTMELISSHDFLLLDEESGTLQLSGTESSVPAQFNDTILNITYTSNQTHEFLVPIKATFEESIQINNSTTQQPQQQICQITSLTFAQPEISLTSKVGSVPSIVTIPEIIQTPNCNSTFDLFTMQVSSNTLDKTLAESVITFDQATKSITIGAFDEIFVGAQMLISITIDQSVVNDAGKFQVIVTFEKGGAIGANDESTTKEDDESAKEGDETTKDGDEDLTVLDDNQEETSENQDDGQVSEDNLKTDYKDVSSIAETVEEAQQIVETLNELGLPDLEVPPMNEEQKELLKAPVESIPPQFMFVPIPLAGRITKGVDNLKQVVQKQRDILAKQATVPKEERPPETRVQVDNFRGVKVGFTEKIKVSGDAAKTVKDQVNESRRRLKNGDASGESPIQVFVVKGESGELEEVSEPIMDDFEFLEMNEEGISIKLNFLNPYAVSSGDKPDLLLLQLDLGSFKSESGVNMPESIVKYIQIPAQIATKEEAENVNSASAATQESTAGAMSSNFVVNLILAGSMDQIWSILNSLQIVELVGMFNIKQPGNMSSFTTFFRTITDIEVVDAESLLQDNVYVPEQDPQSLNFQNAGFDSTLMILNASSFLFLFSLQVCLVLVILLLYPAGKCNSKASNFKSKISSYLFWNGTIRLFMEAFLDLALFSMINISQITWPDGLSSVTGSNLLSYATLGLCFLIPLLLSAFACYKRKKLDEESFTNKYGAFLDGTKSGNPKFAFSAIIIGFVFFARRLMLCLTLVFWPEFLWGQIALQFLISTALIILIQWVQPLDSKFVNNMETFNEVTTIVILYMLMLFSDYIIDPMIRSWIGMIYIGVIIGFALCHLIPLFYGSFKQIYFRIKRFCLRRQAKKQKNKPADKKAAKKQQRQQQKQQNTNFDTKLDQLSVILEENSDQLESIRSGDLNEFVLPPRRARIFQNSKEQWPAYGDSRQQRLKPNMNDQAEPQFRVSRRKYVDQDQTQLELFEIENLSNTQDHSLELARDGQIPKKSQDVIKNDGGMRAPTNFAQIYQNSRRNQQAASRNSEDPIRFEPKQSPAVTPGSSARPLGEQRDNMAIVDDAYKLRLKTYEHHK